jgi:hypothetical protein
MKSHVHNLSRECKKCIDWETNDASDVEEVDEKGNEDDCSKDG